MRIVNDPIGCLAFTSDGHKTIIIMIEEGSPNIKGRLIGRCVHGDRFEFPLDHPLYEQVKYKKEYDDLTSTLEEQQEFEKGCLERLDVLTKSPIMNQIIKETYGVKDIQTKDQVAAIMLQHGTPEQQKEALNYIKVKPIITKINLEEEFWKLIKEAANESNWIPSQYYMNDWVNDICKFLRKGGEINEED